MPGSGVGGSRHGARKYRGEAPRITFRVGCSPTQKVPAIKQRSTQKPEALLALSALLLSACATSTGLEPVPSSPPAGLATTVFLIGDAGLSRAGDPLLEQLNRDVRATERTPGSETIVVFLGDNIYEAGLRARDPGLTADTLTLAAQLSVIEGSDARALFIPGNHDWDDGGRRGLAALRAQAAYFEAAARRGINVTWSPTAGCPGPEAIDLPGVRLITLDTQWFLHEYAKGDAQTCPVAEPDAVMAALTGLIDSAGAREVFVLSHHPLRTHGSHGGFFPAERHLFPLVDFFSWAYIPLPVVGTAYVLARTNGFTSQDLSSGSNEAMRARIEGAFAAATRPPLIHAAGHEHTLQVLGGGAGDSTYEIVSGSASKSTPVGKADDTLFASSRAGYVKLEVGVGGVRLTVVPLESDREEERSGWCRAIDRDTRVAGPC